MAFFYGRPGEPKKKKMKKKSKSKNPKASKIQNEPSAKTKFLKNEKIVQLSTCIFTSLLSIQFFFFTNSWHLGLRKIIFNLHVFRMKVNFGGKKTNHIAYFQIWVSLELHRYPVWFNNLMHTWPIVLISVFSLHHIDYTVPPNATNFKTLPRVKYLKVKISHK